MSEQQFICLKQRLENYQCAVGHLAKNVELYADTDLDIIKAGIIQHFELAHELAWKVMQDLLKYEGESELLGSRSVTRLAFNRGLIENGRVWLEMIESRNRSVHTYDEHILNGEFQRIVHDYLPLFLQFQTKMDLVCQNLDSQR